MQQTLKGFTCIARGDNPGINGVTTPGIKINNMFNYTGKKIVVTGGGSGIGRAISLKFAQQGAEVHIIDLDTTSSRNTIEEVQAIQHNSKLHFVDITDLSAIQDLAKSIETVDILVNNAGVAQIGNLENTKSEDFQRI